MKRSFQALCGLLLIAFAVSASAIPSFCNSGVGDSDVTKNDDSPVLSTSDMSYNGKAATDCYGKVSGNDDAAAINALSANWGTGWNLAARDNTGIGELDVTNLINGIQWQLTADIGKSGNYLLTGVDTNGAVPLNLPSVFDFVFTLKGGTGYANYFFDNVTADGSDGGTYNILFLNNGGNIPDLSHASGYVRFERDGGGGGGTSVPEPGTLPLMAIAFAGLTMGQKRFRFLKKQAA